MTATTIASLEVRVKQRAGEMGFDPVGIAHLGAVESYEAFARWLERGYAGEMSYLPRGAEKRRDTRHPVPGARSAVVVALDYGGKQPSGPIARYARGDDYHDVMLERLRELHAWLERECGHSIAGKAYVDTGPILERDLARRAGLGWIGKNTMLISPKHGSFFFIGALLLDIELQPDAPFDSDRCGSCTRCLDACPTRAFVEPRVMDARRCISYLTIEHRSAIDPALQPLMGELLYGCDICQDVCPWNHKFATQLGDAALAPRPQNVSPDPHELGALTDDEFRVRFAGSPIKRAKRAGLARNAAIAVANEQARTARESPSSVTNG
jgi:epoxyqueuosine reductase